MIRLSLTAAAAIVVLSLQGAQAATIDLSFIANTGGVDSPFQYPQPDISASTILQTTDHYLAISESASASGSYGSGSFAANMSGNSATGEIKADLRVSRTGQESDGCCAPIPHLYAYLSIAEQFLLTGTGTFSVYALVDAAWAGPQVWFTYNLRTWNHDTHVMGHDHFTVDTSGAPEEVSSISNSGSITDHLLVASVDIWDADSSLQYFDITLNASIATWSYPAFLDAGHTATFMFATTGDLVATPVTPGFLSNPAILNPPPVAPVPLPASALLLLGGLAALFGLRRRRAPATA